MLIHQATIYVRELSHSLLLMIQICLNNVTVNKTPRVLRIEQPHHLTHSIVIPMDDTDGGSNYDIPLGLETVVMSPFPATHKHTVEEYE